MAEESLRLQAIRDGLIDEILKIEEAYLTGHPTRRLPNHASFRFSRIEGESILLTMDAMFNIQVSTGSACSSRTSGAITCAFGHRLKTRASPWLDGNDFRKVQ